MTERYITTIKAIATKKKAEGEIGFLAQESDTWYNMKEEESILDEWLKSTIKKGNVVEFELIDGFVKDLTLKEEAKKEGNWADDMTNFEDLLTAAHTKGLISINTELVQIDPEKKFAIFKATVKGWIGDEKKEEEGIEGTFTGYGDAEGITNDKIKPHWIRMSETRSIVRALRWYTNNATVAAEETDQE